MHSEPAIEPVEAKPPDVSPAKSEGELQLPIRAFPPRRPGLVGSGPASLQYPLKPADVGSLVRETRRAASAQAVGDQNVKKDAASPIGPSQSLRFFAQPRPKQNRNSVMIPNGVVPEAPKQQHSMGETVGKALAVLFLMACIFFAASNSLLSLISYRTVVATASGQGQLLLIMLVPCAPVFALALCFYLVREADTKVTARSISKPTIALMAVGEGLLDALANALLACWVLANAQGSVVMVLSLAVHTIGPLCLLLIKEDNLHVDPAPFTPFGVPTRVLRIALVIALAAGVTGLVLAMVAGHMWWEAPLLMVLSAFAHWDNFAPMLSPPLQRTLLNRRYYVASVKAGSKICCTILWMMLFAWLRFEVTPGKLWGSMGGILSSSSETAFWLQIFCGLGGFTVTWLGNLLFFQRMGTAIPLLLVTPVCVILHETLLVHGSGFFYDIHFVHDPLTGRNLALVIAALVLVTAAACGALYSLFHHRHAELPLLLAERDVWCRPGWDFVLLPSLAFNTRRLPRVFVSSKTSLKPEPFHHKTFILATMWHEGVEEMRFMLGSLLDLSKTVTDPNEKYEAHLVFDDAIKDDDANQYVQQLFHVMEDAGLYIEDPVETYYGYTVAVLLPGPAAMAVVVHLKNVKLVKQKKRWSQNLAIEVILTSMADQPKEKFEQTYLLLLDGDTRFTKRDVDILRTRMVEDPDRVGAVCGRIVPDAPPSASNPMVWYQIFEYAAAHWLQKTAENVFGSVLCCPGCFTLVRFSALLRRAGAPNWSEWEDTALAVYTQEAESAMDVLMLEQGEDRMLSTQLIINGWLLQYSSNAQAVTFCPDSFDAFFTQRRRWNTSTVANIYYLLSESSTILKYNGAISIWYIWATTISLITGLIAPVMVVLIVIGSLTFAVGISTAGSYIIGLGLPLFYLLLSIIYHIDMSDPNQKKKVRKFQIQTGAAFVLSGIYVALMGVVLIGVIVQLVDTLSGGVWTLDIIYILLVFLVYIIAALVHGEPGVLVHLPIYLLFVPTMNLILPIFCIMNLHDQAWGTRDAAPSEGPVMNENLDLWRLGWAEIVKLFCRPPGSIELTPVGRWLGENGFAEYAHAFSSHGFDAMEALLPLRPEMFDTLNIKLGHRALLAAALDKFRANFGRPPLRDTKAMHREVSRRIRKEKELELTELFSGVRDLHLREFLKKIHESLKFCKVDTAKQKAELAELQKRVGYTILVISLLVLAVTLAFNYKFSFTTITYGTYPSFEIDFSRMAGYIAVFFYLFLLLMQFVGMLIYRFGILLYVLNRASITCSGWNSIYDGPPDLPATHAQEV